jgi:hypothetical protein
MRPRGPAGARQELQQGPRLGHLMPMRPRGPTRARQRQRQGQELQQAADALLHAPWAHARHTRARRLRSRPSIPRCYSRRTPLAPILHMLPSQTCGTVWLTSQRHWPWPAASLLLSQPSGRSQAQSACPNRVSLQRWASRHQPERRLAARSPSRLGHPPRSPAANCSHGRSLAQPLDGSRQASATVSTRHDGLLRGSWR